MSQSVEILSPISQGSATPAQELGLFLRRRREQLDPARVGVPMTGRRRTPGLRREEVAQLANVSTTWYTWLEQGRDIKASSATLTAITHALQCTETEARHIFALAGLREPGGRQKECSRISAATQMILDQLNPLPAVIQNTYFDMLAQNQAYERLIGVDIQSLPEHQRNSMYLLFNHPEWQKRMVDLSLVQSRIAGTFRANMSKHPNDPEWQKRLEMMQASSALFCQYWEQYALKDCENHMKRFRLPDGRELCLRQINWWSAPVGGARLMVYVPEDEANL